MTVQSKLYKVCIHNCKLGKQREIHGKCRSGKSSLPLKNDGVSTWKNAQIFRESQPEQLKNTNKTFREEKKKGILYLKFQVTPLEKGFIVSKE